jgi:hypothetical protein
MQDKDKTGAGTKADDIEPKDGDATPPADETIEAGADGDKDAPWGAGDDTPIVEGEATSEPTEPVQPTETEPLPEAERPEPAAPPERRSSPLVGTVGIVLLALMAAVVGSAIGPRILSTPDPALPASVENQIQGLQNEAAKIADLSTRVSKLETDMQTPAGGTDAASELKDLSDRLAKLETGVGTATAAGAPDLTDLEAQVSKLETTVASLSAGGASSTGDTALAATVSSLKQEVDATAQSLSDLQARLANLDKLSGTVTSLTAQVDELAGRGVDPKAAFVVAVGQLRDAAGGGEPFDQALASVVAVAPDDSAVAADIAALRPLASAGVPTLAELNESFSATADAVVAADGAGNDWIDQTLSSLEGLVSVRRVGGDVEGDTAEAVVARAEVALAEGDLDAAVADVATLTGAPGEAAAGWLAQAKNRQAVDKAVAGLGARASDLVTGAAGGGS